ncbi:MAG TPA: M56 family metallopeptidase [Rhizomicrobium sp.]|nr:M56 family metallopeptidase [Rhizomicrobium sp.]
MTALLDHLWQSTLFALPLGALTLLLRRHAAALRFWLWFAASVKFLVPFSVLMAMGAAVTLPVAPMLPGGPTLEVLQNTAAPFTNAPAASVVPDAATNWIMLLIATWAAGTLLALLIWGMRWLELRALVRTARPLAISAPVPVLCTSAPIEPGLIGIFRPVLMLPDGIQARLSPQEMDAILAHEFYHFRRRDNLTAAVHMLVESLFWFHPLVWWLGRRLMSERERACDEAVLAAGNDPRVFAEGILNVCRFYIQPPQACASALSGADLRMRIETILANRATRRLGPGQKLGLSVMAALSLLLLVLAGREQASEAVPDATRIAQALAEQKQPRVAVAFNPTNFDQFAGVYQGDTLITLSRNGGRFYAVRNLGVPSIHTAPHGPSEIFPESQNKFFAKDKRAQYSFTRDPLGRVNGLVLHQSGLERWFKRIDARTARAIADSVAARIRAGKPSPGTGAALDSYIRAMQQDPAAAPVSAGIKRLTELGGHQQIKNFGRLQSLSFQGVAPDGLDLFDASFTTGHMQWWIAPLTADGRIVWVGFARGAIPRH